MKIKYTLNDRVLFTPADNKLTPLGARGREVILHIPASRFLLLLLNKKGLIVSQEEIYLEVWEKYGQRVTPNALYQNVSLLRKALRNAGLTTLTIKTHPKSGFSFYGEIQVYEEEIAEQDGKSDRPDTAQQSVSGETPLGPDTKKRTAPTTTARGAAFLPALWLAFVLIIVAGTIFIFQTPSSTDEFFTTEHELIARVNGCPVYVDRGNRKVPLAKIIGYLREKDIRCKEHDFLYLLKAPNPDKVIVLSCNSADEHFNCQLLMKIPAYLVPQPKH